jgi:hypothetical protein
MDTAVWYSLRERFRTVGGSCSLELEESGRVRRVVINSCVLNFEGNKVLL